MMAVNRKQNQERDRRTDKSHKIGTFLLNYFKGEGQAITYLEDLSVKMIDRLKTEERLQLILERPVHDAWGPVIKWTDDMWYSIYYYAQFWQFPGDPLCQGCYLLLPDPMDMLAHPLSPCGYRDFMELDDIFS